MKPKVQMNAHMIAQELGINETTATGSSASSRAKTAPSATSAPDTLASGAATSSADYAKPAQWKAEAPTATPSNS